MGVGLHPTGNISCFRQYSLSATVSASSITLAYELTRWISLFCCSFQLLPFWRFLEVFLLFACTLFFYGLKTFTSEQSQNQSAVTKMDKRETLGLLLSQQFPGQVCLLSALAVVLQSD